MRTVAPPPDGGTVRSDALWIRTCSSATQTSSSRSGRTSSRARSSGSSRSRARRRSSAWWPRPQLRARRPVRRSLVLRPVREAHPARARRPGHARLRPELVRRAAARARRGPRRAHLDHAAGAARAARRDRPGRAGKDALPAIRENFEVINARTTNWTVVPWPTPDWARAVHPGRSTTTRRSSGSGSSSSTCCGSTSPIRPPPGTRGSRSCTTRARGRRARFDALRFGARAPT